MKTITDAYNFVCWYRRMVIQGQIQTSKYALAQIPCSDYELQQALEPLTRTPTPWQKANPPFEGLRRIPTCTLCNEDLIDGVCFKPGCTANPADVCLAGSPAVKGCCGNPDCVCATSEGEPQ